MMELAEVALRNCERAAASAFGPAADADPSASASAATNGADDTDADCGFPRTDLPVWIMGREYSASQDLSPLRATVRSRLWLTYRRDFDPIGDSGFSSDQGWGCTLRCGQMIMAEVLVRLRLGPEWAWSESCRDPAYLAIVRQFEDRKSAHYSIHQISLLGQATQPDSPVGTWFGSNQVLQVLKHLSTLDEANSISIHIAMHNAIVIEDVKADCRLRPQSASASASASAQPSASNSDEPAAEENDWKPLLLVLPLRFGVETINPHYIDDLKVCFEFPECVGVVGGRPNKAYFFIGYVDDQLVYLDPHTTQASGQVGDKTTDAQVLMDKTYHSDRPGRLDFEQMDPSLAVCFLCPSEHSFDSLCQRLRQRLLLGHDLPLFDMHQTRPTHMLDLEEPAGPRQPENLAWANSDDEGAGEQDGGDEFVLLD